jgi:hypothetical protein
VPGASELGELAGGGEDDEGDVSIAEHGELLRLLEQPPAALRERHLPRRRALYPPYLPPLPRHLSLSRCRAPPPPLPAHTENEERKSTAVRFTREEKSPPKRWPGTRARSTPHKSDRPASDRKGRGSARLPPIGSWRIGFRRRVQ